VTPRVFEADLHIASPLRAHEQRQQGGGQRALGREGVGPADIGLVLLLLEPPLTLSKESLRRGRTKERRRNKKARKKALPASRASWEPFNFSNSSRSFCSRSSRSRFAWPARLTRFCNALKILWPISSARRCPSRSPRFGRRSKIDLDVGCTDADQRHVGRNVCGAGASRGITAARTLRANFFAQCVGSLSLHVLFTEIVRLLLFLSPMSAT